jgi:hypothetical protein
LKFSLWGGVLKLSIAAAGCLAGLLVASALASTVAPVSSGSAPRQDAGQSTAAQAPERVSALTPGQIPGQTPVQDKSQQQ